MDACIVMVKPLSIVYWHFSNNLKKEEAASSKGRKKSDVKVTPQQK